MKNTKLLSAVFSHFFMQEREHTFLLDLGVVSESEGGGEINKKPDCKLFSSPIYIRVSEVFTNSAGSRVLGLGSTYILQFG